MRAFNGFNDEVFAVYTAAKWSSNVYNLPRMRYKEALLALCDSATAQLQPALVGLVRGSSDEIPHITNHKKVEKQWVYWYRDKEAQAHLATFLEKTPLQEATIFNIAPQDKHLSLAVYLHSGGLFVGLHMAGGASIDRRNVAVKLQQSWERENLIPLLAALPAGCQLQLEDGPLAAADLDLKALTQHAEILKTSSAHWSLGCDLPAAELVAGDPEALVGQVAQLLAALLPIYRFCAWSRDNDLIDASKQIKQEKAQKRRQTLAFNQGDKVRFIGGLFMGKRGVVQEADAKAQVKVRMGTLSVVVPGQDLVKSD